MTSLEDLWRWFLWEATGGLCINCRASWDGETLTLTRCGGGGGARDVGGQYESEM